MVRRVEAREAAAPAFTPVRQSSVQLAPEREERRRTGHPASDRSPASVPSHAQNPPPPLVEDDEEPRTRSVAKGGGDRASPERAETAGGVEGAEGGEG